MKNYSKFTKKYGSGTFHHPIDISKISDYDQFWMLPEILELLDRVGVSSYMDGFLWTLNPVDYADWLSDWVNEFRDLKERCIPFARTAYGDILFVCAHQLMLLNSSKGLIDFAGDNVDRFFNWYLADDGFLNNYFNKDNYHTPNNELKSDECFGFDPLLSQGGKEDFENLKIVKMKDYLEAVSKALERVKFFE